MSDISVLEGRLQAALERIGRAIENGSEASVSIPAVDEAGVAALQAQVQELQSALAEAARAHEAETAALNEKLSAAEGNAKNLQGVVAALRGRIKGLRKANTSKIGDSELVNSALEAELAASDAQRQADREELNSILAELEPLMGEAENA